MRTTLNLDDELLEKAMRLTGIGERAALVREAFKALIERESARRLALLAACLVVPILANGARAWGTIYAAQFFGVEAAEFAGRLFAGTVCPRPGFRRIEALGPVALADRAIETARRLELPSVVVAVDELLAIPLQRVDRPRQTVGRGNDDF